MAALAGLAPFNVDSGVSRGTRHIRGGRQRVRDALYMAALSASRMCWAFKAHADRMKQAGNSLKVVIIAIAHKLLTIANAMTRDKTIFIRP
ncbi:transposase [Mesorhizobium sp. DCY119]|uniref:transposase n=1 Tax=Mesorhizobium sp. DCY119 TaxID=2108445 RepID=UPI000E753B57|nr:IS110 family transposase [Mesorhizobium sp. DCY119]